MSLHYINPEEVEAAFRLVRMREQHALGATPDWLKQAQSAYAAGQYQLAFQIIDRQTTEELDGERPAGDVLVALWRILDQQLHPHDPRTGPEWAAALL